MRLNSFELISEVLEIDNAAGRKGVSLQLEKHPRKGRLQEHALATSYQRKSSEGQRDQIQEVLEAQVHEGAKQMLVAALEEVVSAFLSGIATSAVKHSVVIEMDITHPES